MTTGRWIVAAAVAAGLLFALGILRLFAVRFETGDIYPPYSSLRADPLGTKALYQSLAACDGMSVARNYRSLEKVPLDPDTTVLLLGDTLNNYERLPSALTDKLAARVRNGGRLVVALRPRNFPLAFLEELAHEEEEEEYEEATDDAEDSSAAPEEKKQARENKTAKSPPDEARPKPEKNRRAGRRAGRTGPEPDKDKKEKAVNVANWLGLWVADSKADPDAVATLHPNRADAADLPASLPCRTSVYFTNRANRTLEDICSAGGMDPASGMDQESGWETLYEREGRKVMVERRVGAGSIVFSALSYFASNEAMKKERHAGLLSWLVGPKKKALFDEYHLGVAESRGVVILARRYGLQGLGIGLMVLAALFVWKNGTSLVPPVASEFSPAGEAALGKHSEAGLANLLRANIPERALLGTCLEEFKKAQTRRDRRLAEKLVRLQAIVDREKNLSVREKRTVAAYNEMTAILKEKQT
ncbi:MAG: DUF4350 domain-containing protein [Verrucomicrobiota bacterium]|nr:DUF4350 domain-containing protein [Verrucomicrobiota bacterium]